MIHIRIWTILYIWWGNRAWLYITWYKFSIIFGLSISVKHYRINSNLWITIATPLLHVHVVVSILMCVLFITIYLAFVFTIFMCVRWSPFALSITLKTLSVLLWETMLKIVVAQFLFRLHLNCSSDCVIMTMISLCCIAVDFFNQINMLYGTITEHCTTESCPVMSAGPK